MKQYYNIISPLILALISSLLQPSQAYCASETNQRDSVENRRDSILTEMDSVEFSLLTCSPHEEVYSLYGHAAMRYRNQKRNTDMAFNWGVFNPKAPHFVLNFMRGHTDYELGAYPFDIFCKEYKRWGSQVTEQVLDLTAEEKLKMTAILMENLSPENRSYRYNFFFDNCATRPRNIIEQCLNSQIKYAERQDYTPTFREMIHFCSRNHPWGAFGIDLLLGFGADAKTSLRDQEFLPENLRYDIDRAQLLTGKGLKPVVKERRIAVAPGVQTIKQDFPLTPMQCAWVLLAVSLGVAVQEWKRHKTYVGWDVFWMLFTALPGIILTLMLFSLHPTTSTNLQVLLLNPLSLLFLPSVIRRSPTHWWKWSLVLIVLFFLGSFWQDYAEGMEILALCLLLRVIINLFIASKKH